MITLQWNLDQMSRSGNSIIGYGLRYPMLEFVNDVRLIRHRFTSLLYILISHWFFLAFWPVACSVRCGAFIQCGGESATDLRAVQYRARANWIGPEPDSVLRSVRSLHDTQCLILSLSLIRCVQAVRYFNQYAQQKEIFKTKTVHSIQVLQVFNHKKTKYWWWELQTSTFR